MKLNHPGLRAFYHSALKENMTEAALTLGVTQSALSQRISGLEDDLETTLFIRDGKSLKLTAAGIELLAYCQQQESFEDELLSKLRSDQGELAGNLRITAYSSVLRSVIIPKLAPFLRQHPKVLADFKSYEVNELEDVLKTNKADLVIADASFSKKGILELKIGAEDYVVIESAKYKTPSDIYLDQDVNDRATEEFFSHQAQRPKQLKRAFMGDVYGIVDGVEQGLGRAVMSQHLIKNHKNLKIVSGFKKYQRPITAHYYERPYYSKLFQAALKALQTS